jgi:trehalose 6-phosphate phosphatase
MQRLMSRPPMQGTTPVFIGDDLTDEPGFAAVRELGGHGILIGPPRTTAATYGLPSPRHLRTWLAETVR